MDFNILRRLPFLSRLLIVAVGFLGIIVWISFAQLHIEEKSREAGYGRTLTIYELYHNSSAWPTLYKNHSIFYPLSLVLEPVEPEFDHKSVPKILPVFSDRKFSDLFSEYAAILAIPKISSSKWIGSQSFRSREKGTGLSESAVLALERTLNGTNNAYNTSTLIYWGVVNPPHPNYRNLKPEMEMNHGQGMINAFAGAFYLLFQSVDGIDLDNSFAAKNYTGLSEFLPYLPPHPFQWIYFSQFAMHQQAFEEYAEFCRKFIVALECLWTVSEQVERCPLSMAIERYGIERCWGFVLERVVNFWAYHRGMRILFMDGQTAEFTEYFPVAERQLSQLFSQQSLDRLSQTFSSRLTCKAAKLYVHLGGSAAGAVGQLNC